jgi:hypothetical protein
MYVFTLLTLVYSDKSWLKIHQMFSVIDKNKVKRNQFQKGYYKGKSSVINIYNSRFFFNDHPNLPWNITYTATLFRAMLRKHNAHTPVGYDIITATRTDTIHDVNHSEYCICCKMQKLPYCLWPDNLAYAQIVHLEAKWTRLSIELSRILDYNSSILIINYQKGLTPSHFHLQLDLFASQLTDEFNIAFVYTLNTYGHNHPGCLLSVTGAILSSRHGNSADERAK